MLSLPSVSATDGIRRQKKKHFHHIIVCKITLRGLGLSREK